MCLFFLGVNTKQLSNQMLELTKVINELRDVLIQQVNSAPTRPLDSHFLRSSCHAFVNLLVFDPLQVKETSFLRNTISECQACGEIASQGLFA